MEKEGKQKGKRKAKEKKMKRNSLSMLQSGSGDERVNPWAPDPETSSGDF